MSDDGGVQYHQQMGQLENDPEYRAWQEARERERYKELGVIPRRMPGLKLLAQQEEYDEMMLDAFSSIPEKFL